MSYYTFSVPAGAGDPTTQTSLFVRIPGAPSVLTTVFEYDLSGAGVEFFRLMLNANRHLQLQFNLGGYGSNVTADLGVCPVNTWTWVSCGFATSGGLALRGDVTPKGGSPVTTQQSTGGGGGAKTLSGVAFGVGVCPSGAYANWPNGGGWDQAILLVENIATSVAAGNPHAIPTTVPPALAAAGEYLPNQPLGAAAHLIDSGTLGLDLSAGPSGLTIVTAPSP